MINKTKSELYTNKKYLIFGYIISVLTLIPQFITAPSLSNTSHHLLFLFIVLIMLFFVLKFSKILFSIFIIYIDITNIIIGHIYIHWGYVNASIASRIGVAIISPKSETLEYLSSYIDYRDILLICYSFVVLILLIIFLKHFKHSFKIIRFFGFVISILIIIFVSLKVNPLTSKEPFSIPYECITNLSTGKLYKAREEYLHTIKETPFKYNNLIYDKVVIIQGESVNKHHMSIYGYDKNTTPYFNHLKKEKKLYTFNAISPANVTQYSVPMLHSKAHVVNFVSSFIHSTSIITDFKQHGYQTYWISNQGQAGLSDTNIASLAQEADNIYFKNMDSMNAKPDNVLLAYLTGIKSKSKKELYFIHLMGSHSKYSRRYDSENVLFKNPKNIIEEYDNTIFYTDTVLKKIFHYFLNHYKHEKVLFIYISDHGEIVSPNKHGHGFLPPTKNEYDIPFIIFSTVHNVRIDELLSSNEKGVFNLENLNYILEYITGINKENNISYSTNIFSSEPKDLYNYTNLDYDNRSNQKDAKDSK